MRVTLQQDLFDRWIIVAVTDRGEIVEGLTGLAWSGSRWVPIGGNVQISNFDTRSEAENYAKGYGFTIE
jgi:hypothetical protein